MALLKRVQSSPTFEPYASEHEVSETTTMIARLRDEIGRAEAEVEQAEADAKFGDPAAEVRLLGAREQLRLRRMNLQELEETAQDQINDRGKYYGRLQDGSKWINLIDTDERGAERLATLPDDEAVRIGNDDKKVYWLVGKRAYSTIDEDLTAEDVVALANVEQNKRRLQLQKAHALQAMTNQLDTKTKRQPIPQDVKVTVWQRDGGRCVECGSKENLEFDHIIPLAMGGANTMRNLQLLCETCNRRKGASLG
jgi:uncharacterized protein YigA (DUF484 family)